MTVRSGGVDMRLNEGWVSYHGDMCYIFINNVRPTCQWVAM